MYHLSVYLLQLRASIADNQFLVWVWFMNYGSRNKRVSFNLMQADENLTNVHFSEVRTLVSVFWNLCVLTMQTLCVLWGALIFLWKLVLVLRIVLCVSLFPSEFCSLISPSCSNPWYCCGCSICSWCCSKSDKGDHNGLPATTDKQLSSNVWEKTCAKCYKVQLWKHP